MEDAFQQTVLGSEFHPIKSSKRQEEWVRTLRGKWFTHRSELEAFLQGQEKSLLTLLQGRADATLKRERRRRQGELPLPAQGIGGPQPGAGA